MKYRRRYHEIPADQGERSGVAGLHTCDLAVRGGKENGTSPPTRSRRAPQAATAITARFAAVSFYSLRVDFVFISGE